MKTVTQLRVELAAIQKFLEVFDIPTQQVLTFLYVAERDETVMAELVDITGVGQSSVSRNVALLGPGKNPREPGYGLMEAYEDPFYRKRKLVKLTPRGKELVKELEKVAARYNNKEK